MLLAGDRFGPRHASENARLDDCWKQLVAEAPFATAVFDARLAYAMASPRWEEVFGLERHAYAGRRLDEVASGQCHHLIAALEGALSGKRTRREEERIVDGAGNSRWIRWEARPWRDTDDAIVGALVHVEDMSAVMLARREAAAQAGRLNIALSATRTAVIEVDFETRSVWASTEFSRLAGRSMSFEEALAPWPFVHAEDSACVEDAMQALSEIDAGGALIRVTGPAGGPRWMRLHRCIETDGAGNWTKATCLLADIDDAKRGELAMAEASAVTQAAIETKARFLTTMSQEIRTPMNGVIASLDGLVRMKLPKGIRAVVADLVVSGRSVHTLLEDMIELALLEGGCLRLAPRPLNAAGVLTGVAKLVRPEAKTKGLHVSVECSPQPGLVLADATHLQRCLFNLVNNALKFTKVGSITLRGAVLDTQRGARLRYEVEDTGPGLEEAMTVRLFEFFEPGDGPSIRGVGGSGIGLAITRRSVELMGGTIGVTSKVGVGSRFWFEIPVTEAADRRQVDRASMNSADNRRALAGALNGLRVLVVEDNPTSRQIMTLMLRSVGADASVAKTGEEGVEAARAECFDLILMDIHMPGIGGVEATRRIRALANGSGRTPVIAVTADTSRENQALYTEAGMAGVIAKPVSAGALMNIVGPLMGSIADEVAESMEGDDQSPARMEFA